MGWQLLLWTTVVAALAVVVSMAGTAHGQCVPVSGLSFCASVNYSVNASSFAHPGSSPQEQDQLVQAWYAKYSSEQLQTQDCLMAWKAYLCSFYFPKCPYCREANGICRSACVALTARCAHQVQDYMATCYGGNLFVNESALCTPYSLTPISPSAPVSEVAPRGAGKASRRDALQATEPLFQCLSVPPAYASFCQPFWAVASAPNNYTDVWIRMDNVTQTRWSTFASGGVSAECQQALRRYFCAEYFSPCNGPTSLLNPIADVLQPLCAQLQGVCPEGMVRKVCSFSPYTPPDPNVCLE